MILLLCAGFTAVCLITAGLLERWDRRSPSGPRRRE